MATNIRRGADLHPKEALKVSALSSIFPYNPWAFVRVAKKLWVSGTQLQHAPQLIVLGCAGQLHVDQCSALWQVPLMSPFPDFYVKSGYKLIKAVPCARCL